MPHGGPVGSHGTSGDPDSGRFDPNYPTQTTHFALPPGPSSGTVFSDPRAESALLEAQTSEGVERIGRREQITRDEELAAHKRRLRRLAEDLNSEFRPGRSLELQSNRFKQALALTRGLRLSGISQSGFVDPQQNLETRGRGTFLTGRLRGTKLTKRGVARQGSPFTTRGQTDADLAREAKQRVIARGQLFDFDTKQRREIRGKARGGRRGLNDLGRDELDKIFGF